MLKKNQALDHKKKEKSNTLSKWNASLLLLKTLRDFPSGTVVVKNLPGRSG